MNLHIRQFGQGQPLVLFHGWGFDSSIWELLYRSSSSASLDPANKLRDVGTHETKCQQTLINYKVYLVDLPGFGLSDYMPWESFKSLLLMKLPSQFAILGWSMGGLFATRLAIEEPERITHLLNIASSPCFVQHPNWPGIERDVLTKFYNNLEQNAEQTIKQFIQLQVPEPFKFISVNPSSMFALRAGLDVLTDWDFRMQLPQIRIPVCYLFGRLDSIVSRRVMPHMQTIYPEFKYVMFNQASHAPFLSHRELFVQAMDKFLRTV